MCQRPLAAASFFPDLLLFTRHSPFATLSAFTCLVLRVACAITSPHHVVNSGEFPSFPVINAAPAAAADPTTNGMSCYRIAYKTQARKKRSNDTINQSNQNTVTSISGITTNPEQFHQLRLAIEANDLDAFKRILNQTMIAVNDLDEIGGLSLLMIAAEAGSLRIVKDLIARGADQDYQDVDNWTALLCAIKECKSEVAIELIESGCNIRLRDMGGWPALMWASYKGQADVAEVLLKRGSSVNFFDNDNHMTCLCWSAGRGFNLVTELLLRHGAKVDVGDKYGTTPLIWAARKGHLDIVRMLLKHGANVDAIGMFGWSALVVATRGNYNHVVDIILSYKPNVNICDPQGLTPLMTASKEGNIDIVNLLLAAHSYVNMSDKNGDSALIHAAKSGHVNVVEALIKAHADIDHHGVDRKTALYLAVEKGHELVVKAILKSNPNLEITTRDWGDTALLKSVRSRKINLVKMLLDKKAKVSQVDREGDSVLHIAARSQSKAILELILRNPSNSQLLYKPNKRGETPFSIDSAHQKPVLPTLFGAAPSSRRVLEKETQLGYDLYSSAIANLLSEPQLKTPICIGLFAKWGSGKSFLVGKLRDDLMNFTTTWTNSFAGDSGSRIRGFGWTSILSVITLAVLVGTSVLIGSNGQFLLAFISLIFSLVLCYTMLGIIIYCGRNWSSNPAIQKQMEKLKLTLLVSFANPPRATPESVSSLPVRFLFCESPAVKVGSMNEGSVSQFMTAVLDSLWEAVENEFGFLPVRLYRVFRPKHSAKSDHWRWRRVCFMIPTLGLVMFFLIACSGLLVLYYFSLHHEEDLKMELQSSKNATGSSESDILPLSEYPLSSTTTIYVLIGAVALIGVWILSNIRTPFKIVREICFSKSRKRMDGAAVKKEVDTLSSCLFCFDAFDGRHQSRISLVLDALESVYESERLVSFLEAVNVHLANPTSTVHSGLSDPFVLILALDPHHHATTRSKEYLRTLVHLPFYLQNSQLRRVRISQATSDRVRDLRSGSTASIVDAAGPSSLSRSTSKLSATTVANKSNKKSLLKPAESIASLFGPTGEAPTKVLLTDDYFSDVNPKSLRRIMNIVYVQGRLLKAFNIDFNWHRLTIWVNVTEQFPLRSSALIVFCELMESKFNDDGITLKTMYERLSPYLSGESFSSEYPAFKRENSDEKKLLLFLSTTSSAAGLTLADLKIFSPFTINVDPDFRRIMQEFLSKNQTIASASIGPRTGSVSLNVDTVSQHQPLATRSSRDRLSDLSVDGVIVMLKSIDGFDVSNIARYSGTIKSNNINGKVLSSIASDNESDLRDLKGILGFSFGDWLLFKRIIVQGKMPQTLTLAPSSAQSQNQLRESPSQAAMLNMASEMGSGDNRSERSISQVTPPPNQYLEVKDRILEKQVTLEETALASSIVIESPSTDSGSASSCSADGGRAGNDPLSRRSSDMRGGAETDGDEIGVLYIGQNQMGSSSQSVISFPDVLTSPPRERKAPSSLEFKRNPEHEAPNERTPLVSPSKASIASSASTASSSSTPLKKKPLIRQNDLSNEGKKETIL